MAAESARVNPFDDPVFEDYQKARQEHRTEKFVVQAVLEEPADRIYSMKVGPRVLRYHRWTHDQANILSELPFSWKFSQEDPKLTPEEELQFRAVRIGLIEKAILDKDNWADFLNDPANLQQTERIYLKIMFDSMNTKFFTKNLLDFLSSDEGYRYGYFWFVIQGRLPHEIGEMPDSSVKAATLWLALYGNKVIPK